MASKTTILIIAVLLISIFLIFVYLTPREMSATAPQPTKEVTTPQPTTSVVSRCPDEIVIGTPMPISGRYAAEAQYTLWGAMAVVNWFNDRGGLDCGGKKVKIRLIYRDSESKLELAQSLTETLEIGRAHV